MTNHNPTLPPLLFLVAIRCRAQAVRDRALELLHGISQTERQWTNCAAWPIAKHVISLEDRGHVKLTDVLFDRSTHEIELEFEKEAGGNWKLAKPKFARQKDGDEISAAYKLESFRIPSKVGASERLFVPRFCFSEGLLSLQGRSREKARTHRLKLLWHLKRHSFDGLADSMTGF